MLFDSKTINCRGLPSVFLTKSVSHLAYIPCSYIHGLITLRIVVIQDCITYLEADRDLRGS